MVVVMMMMMMVVVMVMMMVMVVVMMMIMHTVKYEYQTIWQFQLLFDIVHIQNTEMITYSSHVHIWWDTKRNVTSKNLFFLCINEHEDLLVCRVQRGVFVCVLMHVTEKGVTDIVKQVLFTFIAIKPRVVRFLNKWWQ
jgi:hypothetical protein